MYDYDYREAGRTWGLTDKQLILDELEGIDQAVSRHRYHEAWVMTENLQRHPEVTDRRLLRTIFPLLSELELRLDEARHEGTGAELTGGIYELLKKAKKAVSRVKIAAGSLGKLMQLTPQYRNLLRDLYRENRNNPTVSGMVKEAGEKFNRVSDLLEAVEYEELQEMLL